MSCDYIQKYKKKYSKNRLFIGETNPSPLSINIAIEILNFRRERVRNYYCHFNQFIRKEYVIKISINVAIEVLFLKFRLEIGKNYYGYFNQLIGEKLHY